MFVQLAADVEFVSRQPGSEAFSVFFGGKGKPEANQLWHDVVRGLQVPEVQQLLLRGGPLPAIPGVSSHDLDKFDRSSTVVPEAVSLIVLAMVVRRLAVNYAPQLRLRMLLIGEEVSTRCLPC